MLVLYPYCLMIGAGYSAAEEKARAQRAEVKLLEHLEPDKPETLLQKEVTELRESIRQLSESKWWQFWK